MPQIKLLKRCLKDLVDVKSEFFEKVSLQGDEMKHLRQALKTTASNLVISRNELERTKTCLENESQSAKSLRDKIEIVGSDDCRCCCCLVS